MSNFSIAKHPRHPKKEKLQRRSIWRRKLQIFDPINLEGIATDAVHLTRYSNAAVIIDKLMVIDKVIDNDKR